MLVTIAALMATPSIYLLSFAPMVKFNPGPLDGFIQISPVHEWEIYRPANWLIDHTPLRVPLMYWARIWGTESEFEFWSAWRGIDFTHLERVEDR